MCDGAAERGLIKEKEAGVSLHWGNAEAIVKLTEDTGYKRGFGEELALGRARREYLQRKS
ncbi:Aldehyde ferredoxin oxidoreductase [Acetomicrobium thermoterrenum DSM 13490]|uniref:Aldehyde ferredoxin oxidoreductase n=1 Tax=Acetomicrobium thermoterrenum DSM 13490 TaxID=1120987 RepID=A0A1H3GFR1_9BACT|nr:Aldehyde ferredoxin oxidoreductase [Acetomicrobium thermoterrenum DSM 13490]